MCGIVGVVAQNDSIDILLEGLRRLEYRGYDSAGVAMIQDGNISRVRVKGKVIGLEKAVKAQNVFGSVGIAHTRWATHGEPSKRNAHPHVSGERTAVVHNGIIENYQDLRSKQKKLGYVFLSETDTEVIAHEIEHNVNLGKDLLQAVQDSVKVMRGAYGLGAISSQESQRLVVARKGSPLVIGIGEGEYYVASDVSALLSVTKNFIFLEEGDVADITIDYLKIYDKNNKLVEREVKQSKLSASSINKGGYRHYMEKEIYEQPKAIADTLEGRISLTGVLPGIFGTDEKKLFSQVKRVQAIACGTSYNAGLVAKYWCESLLGLPFNIEVASEYRYRKHVVEDGTLFLCISQSGETADTIAAIKNVKQNYNILGVLSICNVPESSLVRESDLQFLTHAGPEIGVASTKAFTTQLVGLILFLLSLGKIQNRITSKVELDIIDELRELPGRIKNILKLSDVIEEMSQNFADKDHALFLGRGVMYPIALEGALKLKEISYIHAEAYPAGELKHGPLALVDDKMPVVAVAPDDDLLDKLQSNIEEVRARGGELYVFSDIKNIYQETDKIKAVSTDVKSKLTAPIIFVIPLQLLSYFVALVKKTDIDQPRNLAKSVTVE